MCRKLLFLVAVLSIVSVASAVTPPVGTVTVIDNFESYWGTPAMSPPWSDGGPAPSVTAMSLLISGAPYGSQAGQMDWTVAGGWALPADPTNYDGYDHAQANVDFAPYDVGPNTELRMTINPDTIDMMQYLIEYNGEYYAQTWIPGSGNYGVQFWMPADICPGIMLATGEEFPDWGGGEAAGWIAKEPEINPGVWTDIAITATMVVPWSDVTTLEMFDALSTLAVSAWPIMTADTSGASGPSKMDGTVEVWPNGPASGSIGLDEIYFVETIPEPMTIALLGLGGLALIRRKR